MRLLPPQIYSWYNPILSYGAFRFYGKLSDKYEHIAPYFIIYFAKQSVVNQSLYSANIYPNKGKNIV